MNQAIIRQETIFAVASGNGQSAISIIRISGPDTKNLLDHLITGHLNPRYAHYKKITAGRDGHILDHGLVIWFPGPESFTGEDMAELHVHGSRGVLKSILSFLNCMDDIRPASPGEFTKRAFLNHKLNLASVEGLADLINAETERQSQQALRQLGGAIGNQIETWRKVLLKCLVFLEAEIDFSDEDGNISSKGEQINQDISMLCSELQLALNNIKNAERLREGFVILIAGPPNAGKSTLMNTIVQRDVSIVSQYTGTTRDIIEVHMDLDGWPVTLIDTAGIHDSNNPVEQIGIIKTKEKAKSAHAVLWLDEARNYKKGYKIVDMEINGEIIFVATKIDIFLKKLPENIFQISATKQTGIDTLLEKIKTLVCERLSGGETPLFSRERHRFILERALQPLLEIIENKTIMAPELIAENLRTSANILSEILGRIDTDEILGEIFATFCIGK